ncbi:MAG: nucleotidyltransferase substrate binding protein [Ruminococcus sp.]|nr:nucleotidyltransferase substrate binding protein [Ruminococcus sp.]
MKKYDNFVKCLGVLEKTDKAATERYEIVRTGVIGQFNLSFELAWKALQEVLRKHGVMGAETGSPREILKLGYKVGFVNNEEIWLDMLDSRNVSVHVYDEEKADEQIKKIYERYIPAFRELRETLKEKISEIQR